MYNSDISVKMSLYLDQSKITTRPFNNTATLLKPLYFHGLLVTVLTEFHCIFIFLKQQSVLMFKLSLEVHAKYILYY